MWEPIETPKSFEPQYIRVPSRVKYGIENEKNNCQRFGLSFFNTAEAAKIKYEKTFDVEKVNKLKRLKVKAAAETHISEGKIEPTHGVTSAINGEGHFTLHPYAGVNLASSFKIIGKLNP